MQPNVCKTQKIKDDITTFNSSPTSQRIQDLMLDYALPALKVGGVSGTGGVIYGVLKGIVKNGHPIAGGAVYGTAGFCLGAPFWITRCAILRSWEDEKENTTPKEKIIASGIGGFVAGGILAIPNGAVKAIAPSMFWCVTLAAGQKAFNLVASQRTSETPEVKEKGWLDSKWSPLKVLSDDDYEKMLQEKVLRVTAEIEIIDEDIQALRNKQSEKQKRQAAGGSTLDHASKSP